MGYVKATEVLPDDIIRLIQTYVEGELIYIPKQNEKRWGLILKRKKFCRKEMIKYSQIFWKV